MANKKIGILRFLGTNCDRDIWQAVEEIGLIPQWLWYEDHFNESDFDAFILPGGFSYGDYVRSGALASRAPAIKDLHAAAQSGKPILGICNGFQILCETKLLPGALLKNATPRFIDDWVDLQVFKPSPFFGGEMERVSIPIAHGEGRYFCDQETLSRMHDNDQVWLKYRQNPNGSVEDIAGIMNEQKNVAGLMPHPERAIYSWMGNDQGRVFFESLLG